MARDRDPRESSSRYYYDNVEFDDRERRHRRRHRHRDYDHDDDEEYAAARRERRERRRAEEARRDAQVDLDEIRARRESYYARPDTDTYHHRELRRMAHEPRLRDRDKDKSRSSHRELRRDGTVRRKKRRERDPSPDDRSEDYVYGRPKSGMIEEVTVRPSPRRRSDEGGSSSRTAYTPLSGSRSASTRKDEPPRLSRTVSAREPSRRYATRPSVRRTDSAKQPVTTTTTAAPITRSQSLSVKDTARRGSLLASFFRPPPRISTHVLQKEIPR
ncbi:hypothetical protein DM02DRAFT_180350 [Periconia macrospinosa]|uniref:Uncharacterized protein n=1 Tax=Periconia macrospinosa TaxID=97972 RepID=A0A2V1DBC1_9PLEO|nr:hypothetical protein DM02DRAFT_180350 [Periconia macrospinosa]